MLLDPEPHGKVRCNGLEVAYWEVGQGEPLTLLTGLVTPAAAWGPFPAMLASLGYRVIVIDNRDSGCSGRASSEYSIWDMADDVVAVLDHLKVASTYLVGISMGGMIAQAVAIENPQRVSRMVLLGTDPGGEARVSDQQFWLSFLGADASDPQAYLTQIMGMMTGPGFAENNPALIEMSVRARASRLADAGCLSRQFHACLEFSSVEHLPRVAIPTLVIHGECDRMILPENSKAIAGLIPGAELVILPGVGHLSPLEAPAEIVTQIQRFLPSRSMELT